MKHISIYKKRNGGFIFKEEDKRFPNKIYLISGDVPILNSGSSYYVYIHEIVKDARLEIYKGPTFPLLNGSIFKTSKNEKFRLKNVKYGLVIKM